MEKKAGYAEHITGICKYRVTFIVNATGVKLVRDFDSPYLARLFVNKLKHSRRCRLVSWPMFQ